MLQRSGYWRLVYEIGKTRPGPRLAVLGFVSRHLQMPPPLPKDRPCLSARACLLTQCKDQIPA